MRSGALGPGTLGTRGQAALLSREPSGGYKGEPRGDSRQAARGGHGAGTLPALHAHTRTCPRAPRAQAPRGQSPPRGAAAPASLPDAFVVSETFLLRSPAFQSLTCSAPSLAEAHHLPYRCAGGTHDMPDAPDTTAPYLYTFVQHSYSERSVRAWYCHRLCPEVTQHRKNRQTSKGQVNVPRWKNKSPAPPHYHIALLFGKDFPWCPHLFLTLSALISLTCMSSLPSAASSQLQAEQDVAKGWKKRELPACCG